MPAPNLTLVSDGLSRLDDLAPARVIQLALKMIGPSKKSMRLGSGMQLQRSAVKLHGAIVARGQSATGGGNGLHLPGGIADSECTRPARPFGEGLHRSQRLWYR